MRTVPVAFVFFTSLALAFGAFSAPAPPPRPKPLPPPKIVVPIVGTWTMTWRALNWTATFSAGGAYTCQPGDWNGRWTLNPLSGKLQVEEWQGDEPARPLLWQALLHTLTPKASGALVDDGSPFVLAPAGPAI